MAGTSPAMTKERNHPAIAELASRVRVATETTMRIIALVTLLAATLAAPSAFAQKGDYRHHAFCMKRGSGLECAYDSFQQCEAAKNGANDSCMPNSAPQDH